MHQLYDCKLKKICFHALFLLVLIMRTNKILQGNLPAKSRVKNNIISVSHLLYPPTEMTALQSIQIISIKTKQINLIFKYSPIFSINDLNSLIYLSLGEVECDLYPLCVQRTLQFVIIPALNKLSYVTKRKEKKALTFGGEKVEGTKTALIILY